MRFSELYHSHINTFLQKDSNYKGNIYHYTSSIGLKGILESKKIWFTDMFFLNDRSECFYTFELFSECLNKLKGSINKEIFDYLSAYNKKECLNDFNNQRLYVASFSTSNDNLNLWNYYTKSKDSAGYNLEFNLDVIRTAFGYYSKSKNTGFICSQVIYKKSQQIDYLNSIILDYNDKFLENKKKDFTGKLKYIDHYEIFELIRFFSLFFKQNTFASEKEYRIVLMFNNCDSTNSLEKYREFNSIFIPYIDVPVGKNEFLINSIMISPTQNQDLTESSIVRMTKGLSYNNIDIKKSKIPLRY